VFDFDAVGRSQIGDEEIVASVDGDRVVSADVIVVEHDLALSGGCRTRVIGAFSACTCPAASRKLANPGGERGQGVTVTLVGGGQGLQLSRGKEQQFPYCNANDTSHYYCGA